VKRDRGQALLIMIMIVLVLALIGLAAVFTPGENDHSLGPLQTISHHRDCDPDYDDCDREGGKQTCFIACYIIIPNPMPGGGQTPPPDERVSLFPPTPDKIIGGIQVMGDAGIKLGSTIAQLVIDYVVTVFRFVV